jgi:hypothetical protein
MSKKRGGGEARIQPMLFQHLYNCPQRLEYHPIFKPQHLYSMPLENGCAFCISSQTCGIKMPSPIKFNRQVQFGTVKIPNKTCQNVLPPDSRATKPQKLVPQVLLGSSGRFSQFSRAQRQAHDITVPPSMLMPCPVIAAACGLHKNTTSAATSWLETMRPSGTSLTKV